jgi:hypothetical protein
MARAQVPSALIAAGELRLPYGGLARIAGSDFNRRSGQNCSLGNTAACRSTGVPRPGLVKPARLERDAEANGSRCGEGSS